MLKFCFKVEKSLTKILCLNSKIKEKKEREGMERKENEKEKDCFFCLFRGKKKEK